MVRSIKIECISLCQVLRQKKEKRMVILPICLPNMASDNDWITKREDSCLPQDKS